MIAFLSSRRFWVGALITLVLCVLFFAWEAGQFAPYISSPVRPPLTTVDVVFSVLLTLLLALNVGLYRWRRATTSCPVGTRRATGAAGFLGALALVCPVCTVLPLTLLGTTVTLSFLSPFIPLIRLIALILGVASAAMLWPRRTMRA